MNSFFNYILIFKYRHFPPNHRIKIIVFILLNVKFNLIAFEKPDLAIVSVKKNLSGKWIKSSTKN